MGRAGAGCGFSESRRSFLSDLNSRHLFVFAFLVGLGSTAALVLASRSAAADTWRGLAVAPEFRCSPYISRDYSYPQSVEAEIVAELGGIYSPYTLEHFANTRETKKPHFDAVVANPPFSYRWDPNKALGEDVRFKNYGLAPKSAADFAFLLHGFHYLRDDGVMAIILPHGVLFRGGAEAKIRRKLLDDGHIDTVIGLPANLLYSTGIPVCILVLKKCKKPDDVLFINACEHFEKGKRQNYLSDEHIEKIVDTYQQRPESIERYARSVEMGEIEANDFNLNISRYVSTAEPEVEIDLAAAHKELGEIEKQILESTAKHNAFLKELGLSPLPAPDNRSKRSLG